MSIARTISAATVFQIRNTSLVDRKQVDDESTTELSLEGTPIGKSEKDPACPRRDLKSETLQSRSSAVTPQPAFAPNLFETNFGDWQMINLSSRSSSPVYPYT